MDDLATNTMPPKLSKKQRIRELEIENAQLEADAARLRRQKRLVLLVIDQSTGEVTPVLNKEVVEYTIKYENEHVPIHFTDGHKEYLPTGGLIAIEWR